LFLSPCFSAESLFLKVGEDALGMLIDVFFLDDASKEVNLSRLGDVLEVYFLLKAIFLVTFRPVIGF
jgi:uncharacterized protein YrrD